MIHAIEMNNIYKSFDGIKVLKGVSLAVEPGQVLSLIGENGAGKSTLMKILSGVHTKDSGSIIMDGIEVHIDSPKFSQDLGITIIYQEFMLAPDLSVAENISIDSLSSARFGIIDKKALITKAQKMIRSLGFDFDVEQPVCNLSVAYQQIVEIAKALSRKTKLLILDEPTTVLTPLEIRSLFDMIKALKEQMISIIYISHRLEEVFEISDKISVLRDGVITGEFLPVNIDRSGLINCMIGRPMDALFPKRDTSIIGKDLLHVKEFNVDQVLYDINFSIRRGEVLGLAGLIGSGRTELARAIFGADPKDSGEIILDDRVLNISSPVDAVRSGIVLIPEDRKKHGIAVDLSIKHNISHTNFKNICSKLGVIKQKTEISFVNKLIKSLQVKVSNMNDSVSTLSGGNQQKIVLAKWLNTECKIIIFDEPTRGVDVGAKHEIYCLINDLAAHGYGILVISSELLEIIGLCDRTMVMKQGRISGIIEKENMSEQSIMQLAI